MLTDWTAWEYLATIILSVYVSYKLLRHFKFKWPIVRPMALSLLLLVIGTGISTMVALVVRYYKYYDRIMWHKSLHSWPWVVRGLPTLAALLIIAYLINKAHRDTGNGQEEGEE